MVFPLIIWNVRAVEPHLQHISARYRGRQRLGDFQDENDARGGKEAGVEKGQQGPMGLAVHCGRRSAIDGKTSSEVMKGGRQTCANVRTARLAPAGTLDLSRSLADSRAMQSARRLGVGSKCTHPLMALSTKF
jgi:hypothetical protein